MVFQQFQNRRKTSKTPVCLGGADRFLQISEKQRNPPSKLSMVVNVELLMKSPGSQNEKRARNFIIHADVFIAYSIEAMDRRDFFSRTEIYLVSTAINRQTTRVPSIRTWGALLHFGKLRAPNKEPLKVIIYRNSPNDSP